MKNAHVINNLVDANILIDATYNTNKSTLQLDKSKSYSLIQEYLEGKQLHETEESYWPTTQIANSVEKGLITNPNQIVHYKGELYSKIIEYINLELSKRIGSVTKKSEHRYTDQTYFSVCRKINEVTPPCNYLGITYRILDPYDKQVVKAKFSPFYNQYTQSYEMAMAFAATDPTHTSCISQFAESVSYLSSAIKCSMITNLSVKYYKVINLLIPNGMDKNRPFYSKDLETLNSWISQINRQYGAEIVIDDKGIIVSRNKSVKLSDIPRHIPPISSYVLPH